MLFPAWNAVSTMDRMLSDVMGSAIGTSLESRAFSPDIDVRADDSGLVFACDVPGLRHEDLEVTIENGLLTIRGERKYQGESGERVLLGRSYGAFERAFRLPDWADAEKLDAELADGVLTIRVPRSEAAKPRKIAIGGPSSPKQLGE